MNLSLAEFFKLTIPKVYPSFYEIPAHATTPGGLELSITLLVPCLIQMNQWCMKKGKGHYYENQNAKKQPKITLKISVFLVHHYYENQNVKKNEKNIKNLNFV
jgi:hypothetical protein